MSAGGVPFDVQGVASSFVEAFYPTLLSNEWRGLSEFYLPDATFSRTDEEAGIATPTFGVSAIVIELEKIHRKHTNCVPDLAAVTAQEITPNGNLLVQVVGSFEDQKSNHKSRFAHTFVLLKEIDPATRDCAFFIQNEILVYLAGNAPVQRGAKQETVVAAQPAPAVAAAAVPVAAEPVKPPVETKKPSQVAESQAKEEPKPAAKAQPKKQQKPKQERPAQVKEEKPAAAPAPAKPTSWASIAKTSATEPVATTPAPAPVAAAAPSKAKVSAAPKPAEAKPVQAASKPATPAAPVDDKVALFVGSLTPKADEASVRRVFSAFGKVKKVDLLPHKNVGFVELDEPRSKLDSILKQIADKPITLDGKQLRVEAREAPKSKGAAGKGQRAAQPAQPVDEFAQDAIPSGSLLAE